MISYINSKEKGQNELFERLSQGLSSKKQSLRKLDDLIYEATGVRMCIDSSLIKLLDVRHGHDNKSKFPNV